MPSLLKGRERRKSHEVADSHDSTEYCQHDRVNAQIDACELAHTDHHWTGTSVLDYIHNIFGNPDSLVATPVKKNTPGQISLTVRPSAKALPDEGRDSLQDRRGEAVGDPCHAVLEGSHGDHRGGHRKCGLWSVEE